MNNISLVQGPDALGDIRNDLLGLALPEGLLILAKGVAEEVAAGHELGDDVVGGLVLERLDERQQVRAGLACELLHDAQLLELLAVDLSLIHI